jgi:hypothetical protein
MQSVRHPMEVIPGVTRPRGRTRFLTSPRGIYNTAVGLFSLSSNTTGKFNTATGAGTLLVNTADNNTATGAGAVLSNTTGDRDTANGTFALFNNTTEDSNTCSGLSSALSEYSRSPQHRYWCCFATKQHDR